MTDKPKEGKLTMKTETLTYEAITDGGLSIDSSINGVIFNGITHPLPLPLQTYKFGKYLRRCAGALSATKLATPNELYGNPLYIIHKTIGTQSAYRKKAIYADDSYIFRMLDIRHIELIPRKEPREIVTKFYKLRENLYTEINTFVASCNSIKIPKKITLYSGTVISTICTTDADSTPTNIGIIKSQPKVFDGCDFKFEAFQKIATERYFNSFSFGLYSRINNIDDIGFISNTIEGKYGSVNHEFTMNNRGYIEVLGVDLIGIFTDVITAYNTIVKDFNLQTEQLREEYISNYIMNSTDDNTMGI